MDIDYCDFKTLKDALIQLYKRSGPTHQAYIIDVLHRVSVSISKYCNHQKYAFDFDDSSMLICMDCGARKASHVKLASEVESGQFSKQYPSVSSGLSPTDCPS